MEMSRATLKLPRHGISEITSTKEKLIKALSARPYRLRSSLTVRYCDAAEKSEGEPCQHGWSEMAAVRWRGRSSNDPLLARGRYSRLGCRHSALLTLVTSVRNWTLSETTPNVRIYHRSDANSEPKTQNSFTLSADPNKGGMFEQHEVLG